MEQTKCNYHNCTNMIEQTPHKRKRLYCSDAHRKAAQRLRIEGEQIQREALAEKKLTELWTSVPEQVVTRLHQLRRTYGVWAALAATEAVIAYKNVTEPIQATHLREVISNMPASDEQQHAEGSSETQRGSAKSEIKDMTAYEEKIRELECKLAAHTEAEELFHLHTEALPFLRWIRGKRVYIFWNAPQGSFHNRFLSDCYQGRIPEKAMRSSYEKKMRKLGYSEADIDTFHLLWKAMLLEDYDRGEDVLREWV